MLTDLQRHRSFLLTVPYCQVLQKESIRQDIYHPTRHATSFKKTKPNKKYIHKENLKNHEKKHLFWLKHSTSL
jgi:hypothetical protein